MNEEQNMQNDYEPYYEPKQPDDYQTVYESSPETYYESHNNSDQTASDTEDKTPNILCAISLACEVIPTIVSGVAISCLYNVMDENASSAMDVLTNVLGALDFILMTVGLILMIYVRVKYPKNVFGKVIMWLYIAAAAIMTLLTILYMVIALIACISCVSCIQDLG